MSSVAVFYFINRLIAAKIDDIPFVTVSTVHAWDKDNG